MPGRSAYRILSEINKLPTSFLHRLLPAVFTHRNIRIESERYVPRMSGEFTSERYNFKIAELWINFNIAKDTIRTVFLQNRHFRRVRKKKGHWL